MNKFIIGKYHTRCINSPISCSYWNCSVATLLWARLLVLREGFSTDTFALVFLFTVFVMFRVTKPCHVTIFKTSFFVTLRKGNLWKVKTWLMLFEEIEWSCIRKTLKSVVNHRRLLFQIRKVKNRKTWDTLSYSANSHDIISIRWSCLYNL